MKTRLAILILCLGIIVLVTLISKSDLFKGWGMTPEEATREVEAYLLNPSVCPANKDIYEISKIAELKTPKTRLVIAKIMLPKRIDFDLVDISSGKNVTRVIYKPDRGCAGVMRGQ